MSLDNFGNVSDVVVHGHKDRPAMSGAVHDLLSGSHANIFRPNSQSDARPLNSNGSNDYIDFAVLGNPYGGSGRSHGQDGRHGRHGYHGFDGHPVTDGRSGHGHHENNCANDCAESVPQGDTAGSDASVGGTNLDSFSAQDKLDELLLDLERAMRATGRGSTAIATEWMREAQADLMELMQVLGGGAGTVSESNDCSADCNTQGGGGHDNGAETSSTETSPAETSPTQKPEVAEGGGHAAESDSVSDVVESGSTSQDRGKPVTATIDQLLMQNDRNQNPVKPGENTAHFGWADGRSGAGIHKPATPDPRYNYLMAWNMVYPEQGKTANPDASVEMQNFRTYVHTKDGQWLEVLNQNKTGIGGGLSDADFADPYAVYDSPITNRDDGVASFKAPPPGFNFQPWINDRGAFDNQNIDGIYISGLVRSDRSDSNLVIDQGADWYARQSGTAVGTENSDGVGTSNWLRLTDSWQPLLYSTVSADELRRNPPPGITA
jgi:hypothetical protein